MDDKTIYQKLALMYVQNNISADMKPEDYWSLYMDAVNRLTEYAVNPAAKERLSRWLDSPDT